METVSDLNKLLKEMSPDLRGGKYYIASVDESKLMTIAGYMQYIVCVYREEEGLTIVFAEPLKEIVEDLTEKEIAGPFGLIMLKVYSDLMAVGFLAKITEVLAKEKISVNAFSAYHHDHLLVPYDRKDDAVKALKELQES